ncbi:beta-mannosidase, partial [Rhizobium leguminosarum]
KYTFFAADPRTRRDYKAWVGHVLSRVNTITGVRYSDDPTIFAWDLANEPDIHPKPLLNDWVSEMSAYVKSLAPKRLVTTGHGNMDQKLA